jgi:F-type H+-transporting ATPase subunit b
MAWSHADPSRFSPASLTWMMTFLFCWSVGTGGVLDTAQAALWQEEPAATSPDTTVEEESVADESPADEPTSEESATSDPPTEEEDDVEVLHAGGHAATGHIDHHDPFDLSEGNASPVLSSPADLRFDLAIYTVIVFLLLFAGLYKFAWGPISRGLEKREHGIAAKIEEANRAAVEAASKLREYEARLATATEESRTIIQQAHQDAQRSSERIIAEAQERAERERSRAVSDIEAAKNVALESISQKTVELAMSLAGRIVRKELNEADHAQLIREALEKLPSRN